MIRTCCFSSQLVEPGMLSSYHSDKFKLHNSVMFWTHWLCPPPCSCPPAWASSLSPANAGTPAWNISSQAPSSCTKGNCYNSIICLKHSFSLSDQPLDLYWEQQDDEDPQLPQQAGDRGCEEDRFLLPSERDNLNRTCSSPGTWVSYSTTCPPSSRSSQTGYWLPFITWKRWPSKIQRKKKKKTWVTAVRGIT